MNYTKWGASGLAMDGDSGMRVVLAVPDATTRSIAPDMTACAAKCAACWDEPHWRSTVVEGTWSGSPAESHPLRPMLMDCSPTCETQPVMLSFTIDGSTPVRANSSFSALANKSTG